MNEACSMAITAITYLNVLICYLAGGSSRGPADQDISEAQRWFDYFSSLDRSEGSQEPLGMRWRSPCDSGEYLAGLFVIGKGPPKLEVSDNSIQFIQFYFTIHCKPQVNHG